MNEQIGFMLSVVEEYYQSNEPQDQTEKVHWQLIVIMYLAVKCWAYLNTVQMFGVDFQKYLCLCQREFEANWSRLPPKVVMEMLDCNRMGYNCTPYYFNAKKFYKYLKIYSRSTGKNWNADNELIEMLKNVETPRNDPQKVRLPDSFVQADE